MSAASQRKASRRKPGRNAISEQFSAHPVSLLWSPAWVVLSRGARMFLDRLELELCLHGGHDNGKLPLTVRDCVKYGMHPNAVSPAQREVQALGLAELTRRGRAGNREYRQPNLWRLTYINSLEIGPTHEWRAISTIERADEIATAARANKNPLAVSRGQRNAQKNKKQHRETDVGFDIGNRCHCVFDIGKPMSLCHPRNRGHCL